MIIVATVYGIFRVFTRAPIARRLRLTEFAREWVSRREVIKPVSFEGLAVVTSGYGVFNIDVGNENTLQN